jgi:hypothetical protein
VIDLLTMEMFTDLEDNEFIVDVDETNSVGMELIEVNDLSERSDSAGVRTPFSLIFRGPDEPVYPQQTYRFEHEELGAHEIFIVPIGADKEGVRYEAVFS